MTDETADVTTALPGRKPEPLRLSWDSSILIAFLNGEPAGAGGADVVNAVDAGQATLISSAVVVAEVLRPKYDAATLALYDRAFGLPGVEVVNVDADLARFAADLRAECPRSEKGRTLQVADAIILATAVRHTDVLYARDRHLLRLNGHALTGGLTIIELPPAAA
ncbi:type II toxin-antitoxin system VapC family toxin [Alienimonas chondri]|uniref:PIN domain-containing protein n=1 Tax=Alienimonas chondri TaxID=2681879 RepID=A0ABX1VA83_9PLAN|nr:PIN domain-containing protein [Alienimonas chondri]NNJ24351.1 hypothetical protein [Alienimonas chondri]